DLSELYAFFLTQIRQQVGDEKIEVLSATAAAESSYVSAWEGLVQPLLGVLAVAREPLDVAQLAVFGRLPVEQRWVDAALQRLDQFLDREDGLFRLYHSTFPEFLTAKETRTKYRSIGLDPAEWHRKIAASYRRQQPSWGAVDWRQVDDYGLRWLTYH